jgi:type I restriction enzyme, S subunit
MEVKPGYKQTEVGVIPKEWEAVPLEFITPKNRKNGIVDGPFGSNLKTIHYRTSGIPIITSGYVTDGRFHADKYLYVDRSKFQEEKRSAVQPGDIVMAKIGERCGASAILPHTHETGILSGNALKITVDESRHSTSYVWQVLWNMHVSGKLETLRTVGAQPALSMASLKRHKIPVPPTKVEQRAIAEALSDVDALLDGLDRLIAKKRDLKQAAMQQLLTGQTRLPGFHGEWQKESFGDVFRKVNAKEYQVQTTEYQTTGMFPIVDQGQEAVVGFSDRADKRFHCPEDGVVIFGDHTCIVKFVDFDFVVGADGTQILAAKPGHCARFHSLQIQFRGIPTTGYNRHFKFLKERAFVSPPIPEQTAIAEVLTDMDAELAALEQRREKTRALKQAMMQELLTGRTRLI